MTDQQAQMLVEKISLLYFNRPFLHKATFNGRLKTTGGRYLLRSHNIELNHKLYEHFGEDELIGIIKHELCHYHLHIQGLGYQHRDKDFRELLKLVDAPRFCSTIQQVKSGQSKKMHIYQCKKCAQLYKRKRRMDISKYRCGHCKGELIFIKTLNT